MLTKVEIENYQSHKKTVLEFIPGTNVIIGETDAGKSVILRAIRWVAENRPLGDGFRSEWGGDTKVTLHTSEGNVIERIRTASRNEYIVNGMVLEAFGAAVPEEVINVLQLDSANIQTQRDGPFLLAATPGEAARLLNKAASIDDIDRTISELKKSQNKLDSNIKHYRSQLLESNQQMEQYSDIPIIENKLKSAEELEKIREEKARALKNLKQAVSSAEKIGGQLKKMEHVPELFQKCIAIEKQLSSYRNRRSLHEKRSEAVRRLRELQDLLNSTEYVEHAISILKEAEEQAAGRKEKDRRLRELMRLNNKGRQLSVSIDKIQKTVEKKEQEFLELSSQSCVHISKSGCPVLGIPREE